MDIDSTAPAVLAFVKNLFDKGVPVFAQGPDGVIEIGRIHLDVRKMNDLLRVRALDERFSTTLWRALNSKCTNRQSDAELSEILSDIVRDSIVPEAYVQVLTGLLRPTDQIDAVISDAVARAAKGLQFCRVCGESFHRSRKLKTTCARAACQAAIQAKPRRQKMIRAAEYFRQRRKQLSAAEFRRAFDEAAAPKRLKPGQNYASLIDHDPRFTKIAEGLARRSPRLKKAITRVRRNNSISSRSARIKM